MRKLIKFLNTFSFFKLIFSGDKDSALISSLPDEIHDNERIVRFIYSPFHLNKSKNRVVAGAYKTPLEMDEVSVNRFDYTNANWCKNMGLFGQNLPSKTFFGLAMLNANEIREVEAAVVYSPVLNKERRNPFHADIKIGYTPMVRGEQFPSEYQYKISHLAKKARLYIDENLGSDTWEIKSDLV
jgi:hypothetical protein